MKYKSLLMLSGIGATLILTTDASAVYNGLSVQLTTNVVGGGALRSVYRVYADFTDENDYVTAVAGSPIVGVLVIESRDIDDSGLGTNFFNPGGSGSNTEPSSPASPNYWGTYVTIGISDTTQASWCPGVASAGDCITLSPGFPNFIAGNQLITDNAAWFTAGPMEFGRAGFLGDGDWLLRVQIMQLTVNQGENVRGTVSISGVNAGDGAFLVTAQTFASVPGPGGVGLLGVAGLMGRARRRSRN